MCACVSVYICVCLCVFVLSNRVYTNAHTPNCNGGFSRVFMCELTLPQWSTRSLASLARSARKTKEKFNRINMRWLFFQWHDTHTNRHFTTYWSAITRRGALQYIRDVRETYLKQTRQIDCKYMQFSDTCANIIAFAWQNPIWNVHTIEQLSKRSFCAAQRHLSLFAMQFLANGWDSILTRKKPTRKRFLSLRTNTNIIKKIATQYSWWTPHSQATFYAHCKTVSSNVCLRCVATFDG